VSQSARQYAEPRWSPAAASSAAPVRFHLTTAAALNGATTHERVTNLDSFRPGVCVLHPEYGLGRIMSVDGAGPNRKGTIVFVGGNQKTFVLAMAPLKPVSP
jgi:DNA helicase-2/ATP-dependent DNA helicase PcrA